MGAIVATAIELRFLGSSGKFVAAFYFVVHDAFRSF